MLPADTSHQLLMKFANESQRERQGFESFNSVFERYDIVADLAQIFRAALDGRTGLRREQFSEGGLSTFNAAGKHRFTANEWANENVGIWKTPPFARKFTDKRGSIR